jgi:quinol monooxygenase YgiN
MLKWSFPLPSIGTFGSLIATAVAVLGFAGVAKAEPSVSQDVVLVYGELAPTSDAERDGRAVLKKLTNLATTKFGARYFSGGFEIGRPNRFILTEIWSDGGSYTAFTGAGAAQQLITQLQPLLIAPLDDRHGTFVMPSSSQYHPIAQHPGQIIVIAHVDFVPAGLEQGLPALKKFATESMADPGVVLFTPITWSPTNNHFQLIEIYDSLNSFDEHIQAAHTVAFRNTIRPLVGAPYDERRYLRSVE